MTWRGPGGQWSKQDRPRGGGCCFAGELGDCRALCERCCEGCRFFKTVAQLQEERRRSARRLEALGLRTWAVMKYSGFGGEE